MRTFTSFLKVSLIAILTLSASIVFAAPSWTRIDYTSTTAFVGEVKINTYDAAFPVALVAGDYIGAFVNGECRMIAQVFAYNSSLYVSSVIHGGDIFGGTNASELVEFKVWDNSANAEVAKTVKGTLNTVPGGEILDYIIGKPNTNSELASLAITGITLSPTFATGTINYAVSVPAGTTLPAAIAHVTSLVDSRATVVVDPATNFTTDKSTTIVVTAEDGTKTTYTIVYTELLCTTLAPTALTPVLLCAGSTATALTATGTNLKWYSDATTTTALASAPVPSTVLAGNTTYYVSQTTTCESPRTPIIVTVNPKPTYTIAGGNTYCVGETISPVVVTFTSGTAPFSITYSPSAVTASAIAGTSYSIPVPSTAGTYAYALTSIADKNCSGTATVASSTITINAIPVLPVATATIPVIVGAASPALTASVTDGGTITWYNASNVQIGTGASFPSGVSTATTSSTDFFVSNKKGTCESAKVKVTVVVGACATPAPVFASTSYSICSTEPFPTIAGTGTTLKWYSDIALSTLVYTGASYQPTTVGTYYVTNTNVCVSPSVAITVAKVANPLISIGNIASLCNNSATTKDISTLVSKDPGTVAYTINKGTITPNGLITLAGVGTYTVTAQITGTTTEACKSTATASFDVYALPTVSIVAPANVCASENVQLTLTPATGGTLTGTGTSALTFIPSQAGKGTHTLTYAYSDANLCSSSAQATIEVVAPVVPVTSANITVTIGATSPSLSATVTDGGTITWYNDANVQIGTGTTIPSGVITTAAIDKDFYVSNKIGTCESVKQKVTVSVTNCATPLPSLTQTTYTTCQGQAFPTIVGIGTTLKWYSDAALTTLVQTGASYQPTTAGTYYVTNTNVCASAAVSVIAQNITLPAKPTVADVTVCQGASIPALTATGTSIKWYNATKTPIAAPVLPTGAGSYFATQTVNGCESDYAAIAVVVNPKPTAPVASNVTITVGSTVPSLTATGTNLKWYDNAQLQNGISIQSLITGKTAAGVYTYYVTQSNGLCESDATTVTLTINDCSIPAPSVLSASQTVCQGTSYTFTAISINGNTLEWKNNLGAVVGTNSTFATSTAGTYTVVQKQGTCVSPEQTVELFTKPIPAAPVVSSVTTCEGVSSQFTSTVVTKWFNGQGDVTPISTGVSFSPNVTAPNVYTYFVSQDVNGCESTKSPISYTIVATPTLSVNNQVGIFGTTIPNLSVTTNTGNTVTWYSESNSLLQTGVSYATGKTAIGVYNYLVDVKNAQQCTSAKQIITLEITACNITAPVTSTSKATVCFGSANPLLQATGTNSIIWYSDAALTTQASTQASFTPTNSQVGTYTYYAIQNGACKSPAKSISFSITALPNPQIIAATSISVTDSPITISVSPAGGVLSGTGVSGSTFNPSTLTPNTYAINYVYTDGNSCVKSVTHSIVVNAAVLVDRTQLGDTITRAENVYSQYVNSSDYTTHAKNVFESAINAAKYYYDNYTSYTNTIMTTQTNTLSNAIQAFLDSKVSSVNLSALEAKIVEANSTYNTNLSKEGNDIGQYPTVSFVNLQKAIDKAEAVVANPPTTQQGVVDAVDELDKAILDFKNSIITSIEVKGLVLSQTEIKLIVGQTITPEVLFTPSNSSGMVVWMSGNSNVATVVSTTGLITAKAAGNALLTIQLASNPSISTTVIVRVSPIPTLVSTNINPIGNQIILKFSESMKTPTADIYQDLVVTGINPPFYPITDVKLDPTDNTKLLVTVSTVIDNPALVSVVYNGTSIESENGAPMPSFNTHLVGLEEIPVNIFIYPTISSSTINMSGIEKADNLLVVSTTGQIVASEKVTSDSQELQVASLAQGTYTIVFVKDGLIMSKAQFIKK